MILQILTDLKLTLIMLPSQVNLLPFRKQQTKEINMPNNHPEICGPLKALFQTADYQDIIKGLPANHISLLNRII